MITFISVVRDFEMYDKLVQTNPNTKGAEFVSFDNRVENKPISVQYKDLPARRRRESAYATADTLVIASSVLFHFDLSPV
jgi:hypothetical protein